MARSSCSPSVFAWALMEALLWSPSVYGHILRQRTKAMRNPLASELRRTLQAKFREGHFHAPLQPPAALQVLHQPPRRPLHDPEVALPQPRIGLVAHAAQSAVEPPVREHERHGAVGAHVRLAGHPEVPRRILALRVGDQRRDAPAENPLVAGLTGRGAPA